MKILEDLCYSDNHEWVKMEADKAYIGITDYAQDSLGDIIFVELPFEEEEYEAGESLGVIESVKAVVDIYAPVSGEIIEVNEELQDNPEEINEEPYESWILAIELADESELDGLMSAEEYGEFCEQEGEQSDLPL